MSRSKRHAALVGPALEVLLHEVAGEAVDAGRHRRVGGEDGAGPHRLDGLVEGEPVVEDGPPDALEAEEAGVALVGVEDLRLVAELLEGPHAADAEQDLLAEPVLGVAAVEAVGDRAAVVVVLLDVGVEQVERHPADLGPPDAGDAAGCRPGRPAPARPRPR